MSSGGVATAPPAPAASSDHADAAADSTAGSSSSASTDSSSSAAAASSSSYVPIREVATKVHESLANSNYSVVRLGTAIADTLSSTALSFVPTPVKTTAVSLSNPLIDAADTQLEHAFNRLQPVRAEVSKQVASLSSAFNRHTDEAQRYFMPAEWFAQVDEVMASGKSAQQLVRLRQSDLQPVLQTFYVAAAYQFLSLVRRGQSGLQPFLDSLRQEMEKVWTDTLEGPATTFFDAAMRVYREAGSRARDLTSKTLIDKVKPLLGEQYETEVMHAYQAGNVTNSQLVYISSLQLFKQLQDRLKQKKLQADALQAEFLAAMKDKLGSAYNSGLEAKLTELISTWTEAVRERKKTIGDNIFDKYQYLLLSAQQVFDKVLPPVMSSEEDEEKKEESKGGRREGRCPQHARRPRLARQGPYRRAWRGEQRHHRIVQLSQRVRQRRLPGREGGRRTGRQCGSARRTDRQQRRPTRRGSCRGTRATYRAADRAAVHGQGYARRRRREEGADSATAADSGRDSAVTAGHQGARGERSAVHHRADQANRRESAGRCQRHQDVADRLCLVRRIESALLSAARHPQSR